MLAVALAGLAGFVDAVAFIELGGYFVSFMTGNSVQIGTGLAEHASAVILPLSLVALFVAGVVASSLAVHKAGRFRAPATLLLVAALLSAAAFAAAEGRSWIAIACMALAMGSENAVFQRNGEVSIGVTYMTGALVKMGQGMAAALRGGGHSSWFWHFCLWVGLASGAVAGAFAFRAFAMQALWLAVAASLIFALAALLLMPAVKSPDL
ncbi:DUF1275 domain-containing protein [Aliihoeflea sp. 40Bstr573]|nr:DUF1275 family protein [Aliihoeflea sp. 40Bstr573]MCO6388381.1 DUF1275 domain-containing protein [Aliihoeflea sp. 40Bstr573]